MPFPNKSLIDFRSHYNTTNRVILTNYQEVGATFSSPSCSKNIMVQNATIGEKKKKT